MFYLDFALKNDFSQLDFNKAFVFWFITWFYKKRFYNRETIATLNKKCLSYPYLNLRIVANHDKVDGLSANIEILIKRIVSLHIQEQMF